MLDAAALKQIGSIRWDRVAIAAEARQCENDLAKFFRLAWPAFDPASYIHNWHIDAIADHLMAVTDGEIRQLIINVPPRTSKTALVSVAWPAWTWAQFEDPENPSPLIGPSVKFMCLSYAGNLALEISTSARRLIASDWYTHRWGDRVQVDPRQDNKEKFDTMRLGSRISIGFAGGTPGRGGNVLIIDDPHKVDDVESDVTRDGVIRAYDEALGTRFNDPNAGVEVIVMQRLHENDLTGHVLAKNFGGVHLMLPAEYDPARHCKTILGWEDPRGLDRNGDLLPGRRDDGTIVPGSPLARAEGKLLWPSRFGPEAMLKLKTRLGPYGVSGQLQQAPTPRGGGIIRQEWWQLWPHEEFPDFSRVIVSVDTAQTEKEQNDESGITVWGIWHGDRELPLVMLVNAWEGRLEFSRLVEKIAELCKRHKADVCLIEGKSNGIDVINEIRRLHGTREWSTIQIDPTTDKVSRLTSVQAQWSGRFQKDPVTGKGEWVGGLVYAPDKDYAQLTIDRVASFPKGRNKAIVDTASQFMRWARNNILLTTQELDDEIEDEMMHQPPQEPIYDV